MHRKMIQDNTNNNGIPSRRSQESKIYISIELPYAGNAQSVPKAVFCNPL